MPNRFIPIPYGTDPSQQLAMINKNFGELDSEATTKIFYDSNGIPSIAIGVQRDGTSRIRISQPGIDVTAATDSQLSFNSAQDVFKVVKTGTFTVSCAANTTQTFTVAHGQTGTPIIMAYLETGSGTFFLPTTLSTTRNDIDGHVYYNVFIEVYVDATNINARFFNATASAAPLTGTYNVRYYVLQETAA
jgi:hypothetical protein